MMGGNNAFQRSKNGKKSKKLEDSSLVAPSGIEPLSKV